MRDGPEPARKVGGRALAAALLVCFWPTLTALPSLAQVSPEEHARHHPGQAQPTTTPGGTAPPAGVGPPGGMQGMGDMMKMMGGTPPQKELYPSLMGIPEFTPEKRIEVQAQADENMGAGTALLAAALDRLNQAVPGNDYKAMQNATAQMHEALARFESGIAAHRGATKLQIVASTNEVRYDAL